MCSQIVRNASTGVNTNITNYFYGRFRRNYEQYVFWRFRARPKNVKAYSKSRLVVSRSSFTVRIRALYVFSFWESLPPRTESRRNFLSLRGTKRRTHKSSALSVQNNNNNNIRAALKLSRVLCSGNGFVPISSAKFGVGINYASYADRPTR